MSSTNLKSLYSQLVCPSNFFTFSEASPPLELHQIKNSKTTDINELIRFEFRILDQISYFGIKATLENGREYLYKPIEIVTIWGHIARNKRYHTTVIGLFVGCVLLCICCLLRRRKRGYGVLKEEDDPAESEHMAMSAWSASCLYLNYHIKSKSTFLNNIPNLVISITIKAYQISITPISPAWTKSKTNTPSSKESAKAPIASSTNAAATAPAKSSP